MDLSRDLEREPGRYRAVHVDLAPDRDEAGLRAALFQGAGELANRLQRELDLPRRLCQVLVAEAGLVGVPPSEVDAGGRRRLLALCKGLPLPVSGSLGFAKAEVTTGGLALEAVDPRSMEVRGRPGLHVCGELLDADGPIGGFSFWLAFATGVAAGRAAARAALSA